MNTAKLGALRRILGLCAGVALLCCTFGASSDSRAEEPAFVSGSVGFFDINDDQGAGEFRIEYRSDMRFWKLVPFIGLSVTSDTALYGFAGLGLDLFFGNRVVLTPSAAFGLFDEGDGKDLGGLVEFRTGAELAWRFDDHSRLGLAFHHISNASIYDRNPGTEILVLTYSHPLSPPE